MQRRRFLTLLPVGAVALLARPWKLLTASLPRPCLRFHVAGVKFQQVEVSQLARGMQVELRRGRFAGETCFAIHAGSQRLGFVPRRLIGRVEAGEVRAAFLSAVRPHAVPWKQLEITVELTTPLASPVAT